VEQGNKAFAFRAPGVRSPAMMGRAVFHPGKQNEFLEVVHAALGIAWEALAGLCGVTRRAMFDWRQEGVLHSYTARGHKLRFFFQRMTQAAARKRIWRGPIRFSASHPLEAARAKSAKCARGQYRMPKSGPNLGQPIHPNQVDGV
jgi:hypothetical protein